jgi:amino acid transporter
METDEKRQVADDSSDKREHVDHGDVSEQVNPYETHNLKRQLKNRHIAMISIGGVIGKQDRDREIERLMGDSIGVIGTGLFLGTSKSLANGGPAGLLLGYIVMGTIVYAMMNCLGEMVSYLPVPGGHIKLAERFVSPAFS